MRLWMKHALLHAGLLAIGMLLMVTALAAAHASQEGNAVMVVESVAGGIAHPRGIATGPGCFVRASASGSNSGEDWANACVDLQAALHDPGCSEIRIAAGIYKPVVHEDADNVTEVERDATFLIDRSLTLLGGYQAAGGEAGHRQHGRRGT